MYLWLETTFGSVQKWSLRPLLDSPNGGLNTGILLNIPLSTPLFQIFIKQDSPGRSLHIRVLADVKFSFLGYCTCTNMDLTDSSMYKYGSDRQFYVPIWIWPTVLCINMDLTDSSMYQYKSDRQFYVPTWIWPTVLCTNMVLTDSSMYQYGSDRQFYVPIWIWPTVLIVIGIPSALCNGQNRLLLKLKRWTTYRPHNQCL